MRTEEERRRRRRAAKLNEMGRSIRIKPDEFEKAEEKVRALHSQGMTLKDIRERTGIGLASLGRIVFRPGQAKTMHRDHYDRLMALEYTPPTQRGAKLSPEPSRRRVNALWLAGYSQSFQSEWSSITHQEISTLSRGETNVIYAVNAQRIADMYDKLIEADPTAWIDAATVARTKQLASGRGFAPASCWDDDTIDDPKAHPEWTGACGSRYGYSIHYREQILPVCAACKDVRARYRYEVESYELDHAYLNRLAGRSGLTNFELGREMGVHEDTVQAWRAGYRQPDLDRLDEIAGFFRVHVSELKKEVESDD